MRIVALILPSVSVSRKGWRVGAAQERRPRDDSLHLEHHIAAQEPKEVIHAPDLQIINHQHSTWTKVGQEVKVFKRGKGKSMGPVQ